MANAIVSATLLSATGSINGYRFVITLSFLIAAMPSNLTNYRVFVTGDDTLTTNTLGTQASTDDAVPSYACGWGVVTGANQPLYISIAKEGIANTDTKINLLFINSLM